MLFIQMVWDEFYGSNIAYFTVSQITCSSVQLGHFITCGSFRGNILEVNALQDLTGFVLITYSIKCHIVENWVCFFVVLV